MKANTCKAEMRKNTYFQHFIPNCPFLIIILFVKINKNVYSDAENNSMNNILSMTF